MKLNDIISSLSLLIVFVTILFNYFIPEADKIINFNLSSISTNKDKLEKQKEKVNNFIWFCWLFPIVILNIISTWLLLPTALKIINNHYFSLINFEIQPTIFILITIYLCIFSVLSIIKLIKLFKANHEIKKSISKL